MLATHNIDPEEGLYLLLEGQGRVARLSDEKRILRAMVEPPRDTRAYFRGKCLEKFGDAVVALNWDSIEFQLDGRVEVLQLKDCVDTGIITCYNQILDSSRSVEDLMNRIPSAD